jgi:hypothetical protein
MKPLGWVLLASSAALLALGVWDVPLPVGPPLPATEGLLGAGSDWYLQAGYLALGVVLAVAGGWLLSRSDREDGSGRR